MKSLTEYIFQTIEESNILLSYKEIVKEDYRILKSINMFHPRNIFENSNALYEGQFELAEFLTMKLLLKHSYNCEISFNKNELTKFDNIFFDKIKVKYKSLKNMGGYKYENNEVIIIINSSEIKRYETILLSISHELKHAWQDYKEDYNDNSPNKISNTKQYKDITNKLTNSNINVMGAANYAYHCYKMKQDAFASEFATALKIEMNKNNPKDINDCIKLAGTIDIFTDLIRYRDIFNILSTHKSIGDLSQEKLLNELYKIKNKKYSWDQFYNVFVRKIEKLFKKLCNIIASLYFEFEEDTK